MISDKTIIDSIKRRRVYEKNNISCIHITQWFDLGDGDLFQSCVRVAENKLTGNVHSVSSLRFRGAGRNVFPGTNCGKIDLSNVPSDIVNRYRAYAVKGDCSYRIKERSKRLLKSKATFIMSKSI